MDEWMREAEKYLQSSRYNKYAAKWGSKQNTVVTETGGENEWEEESGREGLFSYMGETKTERRADKRVTESEGRELINKFFWSLKQLSRHD